jgi:HAD superfamily hydrolase (TIGR01450 family)
MISITAKEIVANFDLVLLDAFGVLVDDSGALPGAAQFIDHLRIIRKNFFILTNGSKFPAPVSAALYRKKGLNIEDHQVISSGGLLLDWAINQGLQGKKAWVLGPESSLQVVKESGLIPVDFNLDADCLVLANQDGFEFPGVLDKLISKVFHLRSQGKSVTLVCPNPDVIYPLKSGQFGLTTGALAVLIEKALEALLGSSCPRFTYLGKPLAPMFEKATGPFKGQRICLIGDQLSTDIKGANDFGITSILIKTGITKDFTNLSDIKPHYILENLHL